MSAGWCFFIGCGFGMLAASVVILVWLLIPDAEIELTPEHQEKLESLRRWRESGEKKPLNLVPNAAAKASDPDDFSVPDTPRRVPWHIRRKELEAAHKTKRKQLEEYREMM